VGALSLDHAIGVEPGFLWQSVPAAVGNGFKWYAGPSGSNANLIATLTGLGALTLTGTLSTPTITLNGNNLQNTLNNKSDKPYFAFLLKNGVVSNSQGQITPTLNNPQAPSARNPNQVYDFILPTAHPQGSQYLVMVTPRTTGTGAGTYFYCTANVVSSTSFAVWCRNLAASGALMDGEFYVKSIP
jgi:hypothetical protein